MDIFNFFSLDSYQALLQVNKLRWVDHGDENNFIQK